MTKRGKPHKKPDGRYICKCECGGQVRGFEDFGRLWTWCESCTPVVRGDGERAAEKSQEG